jgi:hypothetical protein
MGVLFVAMDKASDLRLRLNEVNKALTKPTMKLIAIHFDQRFIIMLSQCMPVLLIE